MLTGRGSEPSALIKFGVVVGLGVYGLSESMFVVKTGDAAIVYNKIQGNIKDKVYSDGLNFRLPWFEQPISYDVRVHRYEMEQCFECRNHELINFNVRVNAQLVPDQLPTIYRTLGKNNDAREKVFAAITPKTLKEVVSEFNSGDELHSQWENVKTEIERELIKRASQYNIALDGVSITKMGTEFIAAEVKAITQKGENSLLENLSEIRTDLTLANIIRSAVEANKVAAQGDEGLTLVMQGLNQHIESLAAVLREYDDQILAELGKLGTQIPDELLNYQPPELNYNEILCDIKRLDLSKHPDLLFTSQGMLVA